MVIQPAAILAAPLTVAVHALKKPFIYVGFDHLNTDGAQIIATPAGLAVSRGR
jgi:hypothetical protein